MSSKLTSSDATPSPAETYDMEYRALAEDAWYSVSTLLDKDKLKVKYDNFSDECDTDFDHTNFKSLEEIEMFEKRFRPVSKQLQDIECQNLSAGTVVCASHFFTVSDIRFYDAVVDDVIHRKHCFSNGEEQCTCTFVVIWKHGPVVGCLANKKVENICIVELNALPDPRIAAFSKMVREKLEGESPKPFLFSKSDTLHQDGITSLPIKPDSTFIKETNCTSVNKSSSSNCSSEERIFVHSEEVDVGGIRNQYILLIDNLDKHLSPSTITKFIHRLISVSVQAYVFPSLSSETYTSGALVLDCEKSFQKLCEFLDSPDRIIMSSSGRTWVITAKLSGQNSYLISLGNSISTYQRQLVSGKNWDTEDLKVVYSGSEEYKTAKQLKDLFMEFAEHQQRLHKRLALEERKILQPSLAM